MSRNALFPRHHISMSRLVAVNILITLVVLQQLVCCCGHAHTDSPTTGEAIRPLLHVHLHTHGDHIHQHMHHQHSHGDNKPNSDQDPQWPKQQTDRCVISALNPEAILQDVRTLPGVTRFAKSSVLPRPVAALRQVPAFDSKAGRNHFWHTSSGIHLQLRALRL